MRFSKKLIPKTLVHVILWITNEYVICNFGEVNSRKRFSSNWNVIFFGKLIPKTKLYVCNLFWLECNSARIYTQWLPDFPVIFWEIIPEKYYPQIEGAQTVKCKPWTEKVAEKGLSSGVSRAAWKRRINRELEAKKGAQTVN